jgi:tetrahydromethanopterin S-methyltransferase subunit B
MNGRAANPYCFWLGVISLALLALGVIAVVATSASGLALIAGTTCSIVWLAVKAITLQIEKLGYVYGDETV